MAQVCGGSGREFTMDGSESGGRGGSVGPRLGLSVHVQTHTLALVISVHVDVPEALVTADHNSSS